MSTKRRVIALPRFMHTGVWAALACFLVFSLEAAGAVAHAVRQKHLPLDNLGAVSMKTPENSYYLPGRVIVKLGPSSGVSKVARSFGIASLDAFAQKYSVESVSQVFPEASAPGTGKVDLTKFYVLKYSSPVDAFVAARELSALAEVDYAEPWFIYRTNDAQVVTPNDSLYPLQWALTRIKADSAWNVGQGDTSVVIGIVDTGVQWDHPDLAGNIWLNPGETGLDGLGQDKRFNGVDDDGDGKIDDWHGWDFAGADFNNPTEDNNPAPTGDNVAHGTHVAGLASGVTNNHTGIAGVGFHCRILPIKTSADNDTRAGGFAFIIAGFQGIAYAAQMGANVISLSWGGPGASQFEQDIVNFATEHGSLVVAAAGNTTPNGSSDPAYPAAYDHVISVAATTTGDVRAYYSNFGSTIDVCAPGGDFSGVNSTVLSTYFPSSYAGLAGTSQATPLVSGLAALVKSNFPSLNPLQVGEQVRVTCDDITSLNPSYVNNLGKGRINAYRALTVSSPSLRMTSMTILDSAGGNNNGVAEPNETISIVAAFTNYLQPTSAGAVITLSAFDPNIQVLSGQYAIGSVGTMDTVANASAPFVLHVSATVPQTYPVTLKLTMTDGSYNDFQFFHLLLNPSYATHNINNVQTTLTNKGNIGFNDFDANTQGVGFVYGPDNQLFEGGLLIGSSSAKIVDAIRNETGVEDHDFTSAGAYSFKTPGLISDQDGGTRFADSTAPLSYRMGLRVNMSSYAFSTDPDRDYVIVRYDIRNVSGAPISNLYAGLFFDWDMHDPGDLDAAYYAHNRTSFDAGRDLGYAWYDTTGATVYCGARALDGAGGYEGLIRDSVTGTRAEKWSWLSGGVQMLNVVNDIHFVISSGPYTIGDGGVQRVGFALVGGIGLPALQTHADAALQKWNYIKSLQGARPKLAIAIHQNPILSRYADIYVTSDLPLSGVPGLVVNGGTPPPDTVPLASSSQNVFKGPYQFSASGTFSITATAMGIDGLDTVATRPFNVLLLKRGVAGSVTDPERNAVLGIPAGALEEDTYFTASSGDGTGIKAPIIGSVYEFGPGRDFSRPLTLTLKLPGATGRGEDERSFHIYRETGGRWTPLPSWINIRTNSLTATVGSLGRFALGYDEHLSSAAVPASYKLEQNFPNPFNPQTVIRFGLPEGGTVRLRVFDLMGREVNRLADEERDAGYYEVVWDGTDAGKRPVASGIYFYSLEVFHSGELKFSGTEKMAIIR
jgi:serine protease